MKFPGYWVFDDDGKVAIELATFDETELDPATDWKQAWQNQDLTATARGFVQLADAIACAAALIANASTSGVTPSELAAIQAVESIFKDGRCAVQSLDDLRQFSLVMKSLDHLEPCNSANGPAPAESSEQEISFDGVTVR